MKKRGETPLSCDNDIGPAEESVEIRLLPRVNVRKDFYIDSWKQKMMDRIRVWVFTALGRSYLVKHSPN